MGVRQQGLGNTNTPLLKIQSTPGDTYEKFRRAAALYYIRQQMIERALAPNHSATRKTIRTKYNVEDACCAIPGIEGWLDALAVSVTQNYFPDLHLDTPFPGSLECILFTGDPTAVFASKCGGIEVITPLRSSTVILVDSSRVLHAAQRSEEDARASFSN